MSTSRRRFLGRTSMAAAGVALGRAPRVAAGPSFDLVVRGGTVLDGTGAPAFRADVGVVGDRIAALGEIVADWTDVASYLARVEKSGLSVNHALLAGHGTLRANAVGDMDRWRRRSRSAGSPGRASRSRTSRRRATRTGPSRGRLSTSWSRRARTASPSSPTPTPTPPTRRR